MRYDDAMGAFVELAASRHNAIHADEAATIGLSARRLRRGELEGRVRRLLPRVWAAADLPSPSGQALRAATVSVAGSAAFGPSAAWIHGWLDPPSCPQLWVPNARTRAHPTTQLHRWSRIDVGRDRTMVAGIPTLNRAATLCSLGPFVDDDTLERCLDEFLRTQPERWLDETMTRLASHKPGGVAALRRVRDAPHRVPGVAESWFERLVARLVALPALPPLELQHAVIVGGRRYRLDIACPELRLGVEAHSRRYHWGPSSEDADNRRDLDLAGAGWQILYVTWSQIQEPDTFVAQFERAARGRSATMRAALPSRAPQPGGRASIEA